MIRASGKSSPRRKRVQAPQLNKVTQQAGRGIGKGAGGAAPARPDRRLALPRSPSRARPPLPSPPASAPAATRLPPQPVPAPPQAEAKSLLGIPEPQPSSSRFHGRALRGEGSPGERLACGALWESDAAAT
ncbi:hypothetical protein NN561_013889 [Cricetulus griseus]